MRPIVTTISILHISLAALQSQIAKGTDLMAYSITGSSGDSTSPAVPGRNRRRIFLKSADNRRRLPETHPAKSSIGKSVQF